MKRSFDNIVRIQNGILSLVIVLLLQLVAQVVHAGTKSNFLRDPRSQSNCINLISLVSSEYRKTTDEKFNYNDDLSYLKEGKRSSSEGVMRSFFDKEFDTRIFHTNTSVPNVNTGETSVIDSRAKALYVFIHGSGTMKSSGKNFAAQMNQLSELGFAALSFDLPYHADGPINPKFYDARYFIAWIKNIIDKYRIAGMPVYIAGHSFGPDVVAEYMSLFPRDIQGGVMMSPAAFNAELEKWYDDYTAKMIFGGDVPSNTPAGEWSAAVAQKFRWRSGDPQVDPTVLNPDLRVRVLSGDREEYMPGPVGGKNRTPIGQNTYDFKAAIQKLLRNATVTVEQNIGHYIFDFKDANGFNVVLRELLLVSGNDPKQINELKKNNGTKPQNFVESLLQRYTMDSFFHAWINKVYGKKAFYKLMDKHNERLAKDIYEAYELDKKDREKVILARILATEKWAPEFFAQYEKRIRDAKDYGAIFLIYVDLLEKLDKETLRMLHPISS